MRHGGSDRLGNFWRSFGKKPRGDFYFFREERAEEAEGIFLEKQLAEKEGIEKGSSETEW
jgi:hypothetical protein